MDNYSVPYITKLLYNFYLNSLHITTVCITIPDFLSDNENKIDISSAVNGQRTRGFQYGPLDVKRWYLIQISQVVRNRKVRMCLCIKYVSKISFSTYTRFASMINFFDLRRTNSQQISHQLQFMLRTLGQNLLMGKLRIFLYLKGVNKKYALATLFYSD